MGLDSVAIEQESCSLHVLPLPFAESAHEFLEFCASLDLEKHFVIAIRDLDVQMFGRATRGHIGIAIRGLLAGVRHFGG